MAAADNEGLGGEFVPVLPHYANENLGVFGRCRAQVPGGAMGSILREIVAVLGELGQWRGLRDFGR